METWRVGIKISRNKTDGQPPSTAPTTKPTSEMNNWTLKAEGQSMQKARTSLRTKLIRRFFMAYMHESVHVCHLGSRFFMTLPVSKGYPSIFVFEATNKAPRLKKIKFFT